MMCLRKKRRNREEEMEEEEAMMNRRRQFQATAFPPLRPPTFTPCKRIHRSDRTIDSTAVYFIRPPRSHHSDRPWIIALDNSRLVFRHPLTLKRQFWNPPTDFDLSKLHPDTIAVSHYLDIDVDKLLVVPPPQISKPNDVNDGNLRDCTLFALSGGGSLNGCQGLSPWVYLSYGDNCDDITIYNGKIYTVDRKGRLNLITINNYTIYGQISIGITLITDPVTPEIVRFRWRKRLVVDGNQLYLVVRREETSFQVYKLVTREKGVCWDGVREFEGKKVLFMTRDYYFFRPASSKFPGREFKNCIVFSEAAFPQYGKGCWEFTQIANQRGVMRKSEEDDIAVFRLADDTFAREGETAVFPKIDWSPPPWIFQASSLSADEFQSHLSSESSLSQTESELDEDEAGLDSNSKDKEQEEMHSNANIEGGATDKETSRKNITQSELRACISSTTKSHINDSGTAKFEGFDIRSDLVPTLQKIWRKHGNIIENSIIHNGDIVAKALESLATMVQILEKNSARSLTDVQADYLSSTLSDLRFLRFKVCWLISVVDKTVQVHKSKPLVDKLAKLVEEENKLKEEIARVSKMIPFCGQDKVGEPLGLGLT